MSAGSAAVAAAGAGRVGAGGGKAGRHTDTAVTLTAGLAGRIYLSAIRGLRFLRCAEVSFGLRA